MADCPAVAPEAHCPTGIQSPPLAPGFQTSLAASIEVFNSATVCIVVGLANLPKLQHFVLQLKLRQVKLYDKWSSHRTQQNCTPETWSSVAQLKSV